MSKRRAQALAILARKAAMQSAGLAKELRDLQAQQLDAFDRASRIAQLLDVQDPPCPAKTDKGALSSKMFLAHTLVEQHALAQASVRNIDKICATVSQQLNSQSRRETFLNDLRADALTQMQLARQNATDEAARDIHHQSKPRFDR